MTDDAPRHDTASPPSTPAAVQPPLAAILDSIPDLLFACDPAGRILFLNRAAARAFGLQPGAVLGRDLHQVVPASLADRLAAARHNGDNSRSDGFETFFEPPGRWLQVRCFPGPDGGLTVSCRDITEGRAYEEELRASEARYRAMVEDQTEILCRHRPAGRNCSAGPGTWRPWPRTGRWSGRRSRGSPRTSRWSRWRTGCGTPPAASAGSR
jgi:PAS domain S-box-containing protein